ncbi:MAG: S9 family peptidase, partial [Thermoproteota archaeon]
MARQHVAPLIPRKVLFGNPDKTQARLSPDGSKIGYLAPVNGVLNVWVGPSDDPEAARPVTSDTCRGIRFYAWAFTNNHVLYVQDKAGDENWHIYITDLEGGETRDLTPMEGVQARIERVSHKFPEEILISTNDRDPRLHDLHLLDLTTGERRLLAKNEGFTAFVTDDDLKARFARRTTPDGGNELLKRTEDGWEPFAKIDMEDSLTTDVIELDKTGKVLYMMDSRGRDTAALVALNAETRKET